MARPRKKEDEKVSVVVGIPLNKRVVKRLDERAEATRRSRAQMGRTLIEDGLAREEREAAGALVGSAK